MNGLPSTLLQDTLTAYIVLPFNMSKVSLGRRFNKLECLMLYTKFQLHDWPFDSEGFLPYMDLVAILVL